MPIDTIDEEQLFVLVTSKRRKSKNSKPNRPSSSEPTNCKQLRSCKGFTLSDEDDDKTFEKAAELSKIADYTNKIEISDYFRQSIDILSNQTKLPITKIVCFGIGRFRYCNASRYQLAYILSLKSHLNIDSIEFHEPILSQHDSDLLNAFNCELVPINIEGKLKFDETQRTLVYLPHCPKQLINNLLWKNWTANALRQIILISNSFQSIVQQTPISCIDKDAGFIRRIERYTREFGLRNTFEHKNVFNDIAIHFFNTENCCTENIFQNCFEPSYDISELIETVDQQLCI